MSFAQVREELPALTRQQRRELTLRLIEIDSSEAEQDAMTVCEHSAALVFAMLEAMETEDAANWHVS